MKVLVILTAGLYFRRMRMTTPRIALIAAVLFSGALYASTALAGFVWTPPPTPPATTTGPTVAAAPVTPVDTNASGMDTLPLPGASQPNPQPAPPNTRPDDLASFLPPGKTGGAGDYIDAQGFGRDLPLHLVVKQVVPSGFTTTFAPGVDTNVLISWNGGKPWNAVLDDALAPASLQAMIHNHAVQIQVAGANASMPMSPPPINRGTDNATGAPMPLATAPGSVSSTPSAAMTPMTATPRSTAPPAKTTDTIHWNTPSPTTSPAAMPPPMDIDADANADTDSAAPSPTPVGMRPGDISSAPRDVADKTEIMNSEAMNDTTAMVPMVSETAPRQATGPAPENTAMNATPIAAAPIPLASSMPPASSTPAPPIPSDNGQTVANDMAAADANAASPAIASADLNSINHWRAEKNDNLHDVLSTWCARAGVTLIWQADRDYVLKRPLDIHDNFTDAVRRILTLYDTSRPRPTGALHPHLPNGGAALVVSTPSDSDTP